MWRWWPWRRRAHTNGEAAGAAKAEADQQLRHAHDVTPGVDRTARAAAELARQSDRFARQVGRAMHRRGAI